MNHPASNDLGAQCGNWIADQLRHQIRTQVRQEEQTRIVWFSWAHDLVTISLFLAALGALAWLHWG
jgi:hypothetical protein